MEIMPWVRTSVAILALCSGGSIVRGDEPPPDVTGLIEHAREAAARDDHAAAIASYEEALTLAPSERDSIAVPLAAQRTWAGDYDRAIWELREHLVEHGSDLDAKLLLALALSWNDDPSAALDIYRGILARDPENKEAQLGEARMLAWTGASDRALREYDRLVLTDSTWIEARLGQAQLHNWRGDHRLAGRLYRDILRDHPENQDARIGLATAFRWDGRADRAMHTLSEVDPDSPARRELAGAIHTDWIPRADARYDFARDSDDFESRTTTLSAEVPYHYRGHLRAALYRNDYSRPGDPTGDETWVMGGFDYRAADSWSASGQLEAAIDPLADGETPWSGGAGLRLLPTDRLRADLGYRRISFFSYTTFPERIAADWFGASLELRLKPVLSTFVQGDWMRYEDDNERKSGKLFASWLVRPQGPRTRVDAGVHQIDHLRDPDNGIWTPRGYRAFFARANSEVDLWEGVIGTLDLDGGLASDRIDPDETPYLSYAVGLVRRFDVVRIELRGGRSDSNVESGRGYRRSFAMLIATVGL